MARHHILSEKRDKHNEKNQRTIAQVPDELFERFKMYFKWQGIKQNAFFLNCIRQALEAEKENK